MTAEAPPYRYLLDTNVISELVHDPHGPVVRRIARAGEATICTSIVVACELRYGIAKKKSARLSAQVDAVLGALPILPLAVDADQHCGEIRVALEKAGTPIGANDLLIAAHARSLGLVLVTRNTRELERVPGLTVRSW